MKIVSKQSDEDLKRAHTTHAVEQAAINLASNVLRIVRGAGRPQDLAEQTILYASAAGAFFEAHRRWPSEEAAHAVRSWSTNRVGEYDAFGEAVDEILAGALQITASRLLGQLTQEAAGDRQLFDGVRDLAAARAANRAKQR